MLHLGEQNLIAGPDVAPAPRVRDQVQRLGDVAREDNLFRARGADEPGDRGAGGLIRLGRTLGDRVHPAVHVRVVFLVEAEVRVQHLTGFLGGRRAIQIHEGLPVHALLENREVVADRSRDRHGCAS